MSFDGLGTGGRNRTVSSGSPSWPRMAASILGLSASQRVITSSMRSCGRRNWRPSRAAMASTTRLFWMTPRRYSLKRTSFMISPSPWHRPTLAGSLLALYQSSSLLQPWQLLGLVRSLASLAKISLHGQSQGVCFSKVFSLEKSTAQERRRSMSQTIERQAQPTQGEWVRVASLAELQAEGRLTVLAKHNVVALFESNGQVYAVDNRCPHMGFPLDKGTVNDCILTCHWHHARFDLASGGTFDLWADDVRSFPVKIEQGDIWVDVTAPGNARERQRQRLHDGLERNIRLVIAKSVLALMPDSDQEAARTPFAL